MSTTTDKSIPTWEEVKNLFKTWNFGMPGDSTYPATAIFISEDGTKTSERMHFIFDGVDDCRKFSQFHLALMLGTDSIIYPSTETLLYTPVYPLPCNDANIVIDTYVNDSRLKVLLQIVSFGVDQTKVSIQFNTYRFNTEDHVFSEGGNLNIGMYAK